MVLFGFWEFAWWTLVSNVLFSHSSVEVADLEQRGDYLMDACKNWSSSRLSMSSWNSASPHPFRVDAHELKCRPSLAPAGGRLPELLLSAPYPSSCYGLLLKSSGRCGRSMASLESGHRSDVCGLPLVQPAAHSFVASHEADVQPSFLIFSFSLMSLTESFWLLWKLEFVCRCWVWIASGSCCQVHLQPFQVVLQGDNRKQAVLYLVYITLVPDSFFSSCHFQFV
jgi:hypothetical protein